jgi:hypothetical protein
MQAVPCIAPDLASRLVPFGNADPILRLSSAIDNRECENAAKIVKF